MSGRPPFVRLDVLLGACIPDWVYDAEPVPSTSVPYRMTPNVRRLVVGTTSPADVADVMRLLGDMLVIIRSARTRDEARARFADEKRVLKARYGFKTVAALPTFYRLACHLAESEKMSDEDAARVIREAIIKWRRAARS